MFEITRITVLHDANEDRMAFDVADAEEHVRRLWLTKRLLDRLIIALTGQLNRSSPQSSGQVVAPGAAQQAAQVYAQLQARIGKKPTSPVRATTATPMSLVREVSIARKKQGRWTLTFQFAGDEPVALIIPSSQLRQWLESLHRNYLRAQWDTRAFPAWVGRAGARPPLSSQAGSV